MAQMRDNSRMLVQVCESMAEPQTRKRAVTALSEAMAEYGLEFGMVVTRNEEEEIKVDAGKIDVVSAWRFLLVLQKK